MEEQSWLRPPEVVMDLQRLGSMHQSRSSFAHSFIRAMAHNHWKVTTHLWKLDAEGYGTVIYQIHTSNGIYHQVIFSDRIADEERNDRVVAEKWDITFALIQGDVSDRFLSQLRENIPLQEAGRNTNRVLVLARANKSVRIFEHIVSQLAKGVQPSQQLLSEVGYILRTTAVYGNGKFGIADFKTLKDNPDFRQTFRAQMCAVYIIRIFSIDLVHHLARVRGGDSFAALDKNLQRYLGVGNATGLGMALFLVKHPRVIDKWLLAREEPLAEISKKVIDEKSREYVINLLLRAQQHLFDVVTIDTRQKELNLSASQELEDIISKIRDESQNDTTWKQVIEFSSKYGYEAQEVLISCVLEGFPDVVDAYDEIQSLDESWFSIVGVNIAQLKRLIEKRYHWVIHINFSYPNNTYWFWYRSEDKAEPRIGVRQEEQGAELELPLDIARQVQRLYREIEQIEESKALTAFLLEAPRYSTIVRRVWTMGNSLLGDIQANILGKEVTPMYLLRAKLAMLGATKFDPRSDKWVRVTFFQGAPLLDEMNDREWLFPLPPKPQNILAETVLGKDKVLVSHNEISLYCYWAFSGLHRESGEPLTVANMIADMEVMKLEGIKHFAKALQFLEQDSDIAPRIQSIDAQHITIDLQNCSVVCHLPMIIDYLIEKLYTMDSLEVRIQNCFNRWLSIGALMSLAKGQFYVRANWNNSDEPHHVVCILSPENVFPDIYILDEKYDDIHSLNIVISQHKLETNLSVEHRQKHISYKMLENAQKKSWEEGILIDKDDWQVIQEAAKKIMVENNELSQQGAGGV